MTPRIEAADLLDRAASCARMGLRLSAVDYAHQAVERILAISLPDGAEIRTRHTPPNPAAVDVHAKEMP